MAVAAQDNENQPIAERLKQLRAERGNPSQKVVALAAKVAPRSLQNWEMGASRPNYTNAAKIAAFYDVTPEYVLHGLDGAQGELAEINAKLDRILAILAASGTEQIMSVLTEALGAGAAPPPAVQAPRRSARSARATGHRRIAS